MDDAIETGAQALNFMDGYLKDDFLWVSNVDENGLFRINLKSWDAEFVDFFAGLPLLSPIYHKRVFEYNGELFFIPSIYARGISVYSFSDNRTSFLQFGLASTLNIVDAVRRQDIIYLIPRFFSQPMGIFHLKTKKIMWQKHWSQNMISLLAEYHVDNPGAFRMVVYGDYLLLPLSLTNIVLICKFPDLKPLRLYKLETSSITAMGFVGEKLAFIDAENCLYTLDIDSGITRFWSKLPKLPPGDCYSYIYGLPNGAVVAPHFSGSLYRLDPSGEVSAVYPVKKSEDGSTQKRAQIGFYHAGILRGDTLLFPPLATSEMVMIGLKSVALEYKAIQVPDDYFIKRLHTGNGREMQTYSLQKYLSMVGRMPVHMGNATDQKSTCAEKVVEMVKQDIFGGES